MAPERQHAYELIDRLAPSQLAAVVGLLESMLDPVSRAIANAPLDDEPETSAERQAVAASKEWFKNNPEGIPFQDVLADFNLALDDLENYQEPK